MRSRFDTERVLLALAAPTLAVVVAALLSSVALLVAGTRR